jgi:hypothetical protein
MLLTTSCAADDQVGMDECDSKATTLVAHA